MQQPNSWKVWNLPDFVFINPNLFPIYCRLKVLCATIYITRPSATFVMTKSKAIDSFSRTGSWFFYLFKSNQRARAEVTRISSDTQDNAQWSNSANILIICVYRWKLEKYYSRIHHTQRHWAPVPAIHKFSPVFYIWYYL